jgi:hypothetical protein
LENKKMKKDSISNIKPLLAETVEGAGSSTAVDMQGFRGVAFITSATVNQTVLAVMQECDTVGGTYTDVPADQIVGANALQLAADAEPQKLAYVGYKQFVRIKNTNGTLIVQAIASFPENAPQA